MPETVADFWSYLQNAFGSSWPWVLVLVGMVIAALLLFQGRIATKWIFPIVLMVGAFWAIRRWLWQYFY